MKVGNLVKIKPSGMMAVGAFGLIVESLQMPYTILYVVKLLTGSKRTHRFIPRDLEVINP